MCDCVNSLCIQNLCNIKVRTLIADHASSLLWSHSTTADTSRPHDENHVEDPPPPSSPSLELHQLSHCQTTCVAQHSDGSIGTGHTPKNVPSHIEAQSGAGMQSQTCLGSHTLNQSSMAPVDSAVLSSSGLSLMKQPQHQKNIPENAEKSVCATTPEWMECCDVDANSEQVAVVKGSSDPLAPQASTPAHPSLQQPITSASLALQRPPGPDTIGDGFQDDHPPLSPLIAVVEASSNPESVGLQDSEPKKSDSVTNRLWSQPAPTDSAHFEYLQSSSPTDLPLPVECSQESSQASSLATSHKFYPSPSTISTKEHNLSSNVASNHAQPSAPHEDNIAEETSDDDLMYSSITSASTAHNLTAEDSRNGRICHALHLSFSGVPPTTASLNTANHPATSAVATAGRSAVSIWAAEAPQSIVTGKEQPLNTGQSVQTSINSHEQQLSNDFIQPPSTHCSQPSTTHSNHSVKVPSHVLPAVVGLPPAKVSSMMQSSVDTAQCAATVVEVDMTAASASTKQSEQPLAVPCGGSSAAVSSTLHNVERQASGYLGSNQFSSTILQRRPGYMAPHGGMSLESYQMKQDSEGI